MIVLPLEQPDDRRAWLFLGRTRIGAIVRAGVTHPQMVSGLGINVPLVFAGVFAVGTALAARWQRCG